MIELDDPPYTYSFDDSMFDLSLGNWCDLPGTDCIDITLVYNPLLRYDNLSTLYACVFMKLTDMEAPILPESGGKSSKKQGLFSYLLVYV